MTTLNPSLSEIIRAHRLHYQDRQWALGYGCAWMGRKGEDVRNEELELLMQIHEIGFRYFDTARAYGESEIRVGQFVQQINRAEIFLASKVSLKGCRPVGAQIAESVQRSLERLQTDWLDLIQVHDISMLEEMLPKGQEEEVFEAVEKLKADGFIRHFGLGTRPLDLHAAAIKAGAIESILTFNDFSPIDPIAWRLIRNARDQGVATIHGSPLLGGLLAGNDPRGVKTYAVPLNEWRRERAIRAYNLCQAEGVSTLAVALQFPLREPALDMMLTGPATPQELQATLSALTSSLPESIWAKLSAEFQWTEYQHNTSVSS